MDRHHEVQGVPNLHESKGSFYSVVCRVHHTMFWHRALNSIPSALYSSCISSFICLTACNCLVYKIEAGIILF
jgi:hypothetical protein